MWGAQWTRPGYRATRPPRTPPRPCKHCAALVRRRNCRSSLFFRQDVDHPGSDRCLVQPKVWLILSPERSMIRDEVEFSGSEKFHIVFVKPNNVYDGTRILHRLNPYPP